MDILCRVCPLRRFCYAGSMSLDTLARRVAALARRLPRPLLAWYDRTRRDLPWRRNRDPYAVWIAEVMLQQTQVKTVEPYYRRFLRRFPNAISLARAPLEDLLQLWAGLGYYRRAEHLHAAAKMLASEFGGKLPRSSVDLLRLPGVGRYTAAAIASIAFEEPVAVLDGNVNRVLSRLLGRTLAQAQGWDAAQRLVPRSRPGDYNQALMELGATLCTPAHPACPACPVKNFCLAYRTGDPARLPRARLKPEPKKLRRLVLVLTRRGRVLLLKRPGRGLWAGLWEFPAFAPFAGGGGPRLSEALGERLGLRLKLAPGRLSVKHQLTHRAVCCEVVRGRDLGGRKDRVLLPACDRGRYQASRWIEPARLRELPVSALTLKIARATGIQAAALAGSRA